MDANKKSAVIQAIDDGHFQEKISFPGAKGVRMVKIRCRQDKEEMPCSTILEARIKDRSTLAYRNS